MPPGKMEPEDRASNLGEPLKLKAEVASFLEGSLETSDSKSEGDATGASCVEVCTDWVRWKVGKCDTSSWWTEY